MTTVVKINPITITTKYIMTSTKKLCIDFSFGLTAANKYINPATQLMDKYHKI